MEKITRGTQFVCLVTGDIVVSAADVEITNPKCKIIVETSQGKYTQMKFEDLLLCGGGNLKIGDRVKSTVARNLGFTGIITGWEEATGRFICKGNNSFPNDRRRYAYLPEELEFLVTVKLYHGKILPLRYTEITGCESAQDGDCNITEHDIAVQVVYNMTTAQYNFEVLCPNGRVPLALKVERAIVSKDFIDATLLEQIGSAISSGVL